MCEVNLLTPKRGFTKSNQTEINLKTSSRSEIVSRERPQPPLPSSTGGETVSSATLASKPGESVPAEAIASPALTEDLPVVPHWHLTSACDSQASTKSYVHLPHNR